MGRATGKRGGDGTTADVTDRTMGADPIDRHTATYSPERGGQPTNNPMDLSVQSGD